MPTIQPKQDRRALRLVKVEASIGRWNRRMRRAASALAKLEGQRKRLLKPRVEKTPPPKVTQAESPKPTAADPLLAHVEQQLAAAPKPKSADVSNIPLSQFPIADSLDEVIPTFLRRGANAQAAADAAIADALRQEQAERKKLKGKIAREERAAKRSGATRKMPASGKAAMAIIRGE